MKLCVSGWMLAAVFYGLLLFQAVLLAYRAELLSFRRDTSRMALFTSKRFAKTRACHDNFPHLKGNIRYLFGFRQKHDVEVSHFPSSDLYFRSWKGLERDFGALRCSRWKLFSVSASLVEKETHTPFNSKLCERNFKALFYGSPRSRHKSTTASPCATGWRCESILVKSRGWNKGYLVLFTWAVLCVCTLAPLP